jgi:hypothetical protein
MKISLKTLRKLIHEVTMEKPVVKDSSHVAADPVASLINAIKRRSVAVEDLGNNELYIMTGEAEGVTVKVLRRGR